MALGAVSATASAQPQSFLNFVGAAVVRDPSGGGGPTLLIDFLLNEATPGAADGTISATETINGVFDPEIVPGTPGTVRDLLVNNSGVIGAPVANFVQIGGYTFTLTGTDDGNAFGPISLFPVGNNTLATFGVNGTVTGGDYGTRVRRFDGVFTAQFAGDSPSEVFNDINTGNPRRVSYSAEFVVAAIPEPSTYALMATGLIGLVGAARLRRRSTV